MARVAQGDGAAFDYLVRRHLPRAYSIAYRVLLNQADAEEAAQDAFTKLWVHANSWQPGVAKFTTWLHRITVNAALDIARKRKPGMGADAEAELIAIADPAEGAEAALGTHEEAQQVQRAVATLTTQQRTAVTLCYFEHYTNQEAAEMMGLHLKALEGLLVRARKTLRELLPHGLKGDRHAA